MADGRTKLLDKNVERGNYAWGCVENLRRVQTREGFDLKETDYKSYAKKLPVMILTNGFSQAMAFAFSKGFTVEKKKLKVKTWGLIFYHLARWLKNENLELEHKAEQIYRSSEDFMKEILNLPPSSYRAYQEEALRVLNWISRVAEGRILEEAE